ncbi:DUF6415 family natural product biosynthesis protein [Streptomyces tagetis]|uniref:DUF6415 family natural product biosynthesis protein n=1 Tax=Streptomyces tagetis TaxID=2820809 RepID=UPI001FFA4688|nr:DUF6415 family natural product biosynthesis protein [Streptomyces sp. RG38]
MRRVARDVLAGDAEPPSPDELEKLTLVLRGHIALTVPEIETAALRLPGTFPEGRSGGGRGRWRVRGTRVGSGGGGAPGWLEAAG